MSFSTEQFLHGTPQVTDFSNLLLLFLMLFLARTVGNIATLTISFQKTCSHTDKLNAEQVKTASSPSVCSSNAEHKRSLTP